MYMHMLHLLKKVGVFCSKNSKLLDLINEVYVILKTNTYIYVFYMKRTYSIFIVIIRVILCACK